MGGAWGKHVFRLDFDYILKYHNTRILNQSLSHHPIKQQPTQQQSKYIPTQIQTHPIPLEMQEQPIRQILQQARDKFLSGDFQASKAKLDQVAEQEKCVQLNKLLIEFQTGSQDNCELVLGKLLAMLTEMNIQMYKKNRPKEINFIAHEMLYMNIVAIAEYLGKNTLAQLVGSQALFLYKCLQTSTALMLVYQNLRRCLSQNRLSTCLELINKFNKIVEHAKNLSTHEQKLKVMINVLFTSALLKLQMVQQSQALFMLKFQEADAEKFVTEERNSRTRRKNKINYKDVINFLKAQIDFCSKNYQKSINGMLEYSGSESNRQKIYAENNIAINLCMLGKSTIAQKIFMSNCETVCKVLLTNKKYGTQLPELFQKTKENLALAYLHSRQNLNSPTHYNVQADQRCYSHITKSQDLFSFKQQYRRGQAALNLYHSLLEKSSRKLPWQQIHDNYDNIYYFPNQPYYQFKGRNKNVYLANKKPVYRRYVMNQWTDCNGEEVVDKDQNRRRFQKQAAAMKFGEVLAMAEGSFRKAMVIIQREESVMFRIQGAEADMSKTINERLFHEYTKYKSSLLTLLAYTSLCLCKWNEVVHYCQQFQQRKYGDLSSENNYSILTYQMEAFTQLNRMDDAYKTMHAIVGGGLGKNVEFDCRDGSNLANCNMEPGVSQQLNFIYNMSVLHSRNNRIPETHQSIQKLFSQMNVLQSYPKSELPLSTLELLIHYNLRIQNFSAALQLIKRRRILSSVNGSIKPILNITK